VNYFLDSSAVVKLYHPELGSARVEAAFREPTNRIVISRLTGVAFCNSALSLKIRTGRLASADAFLLRTRFLSDVATGSIAVVAVNESH
jgi:hypothetical protein